MCVKIILFKKLKTEKRKIRVFCFKEFCRPDTGGGNVGKKDLAEVCA